MLCAAARPVNIKKGIFPALASLFITLVGTPFGWGATPAGKNVGSSVGDAWERSTMKLFRMASWLGIVIYNLPSTVSISTGRAVLGDDAAVSAQ